MKNRYVNFETERLQIASMDRFETITKYGLQITKEIVL